MLKRDMANKDIRFYFNRQDRACNSGRITGLRNRSYGPEVPRASDEAPDAFLTSFAAPSVAAPVIQSTSQVERLRDPLDSVVLRSMFVQDTAGDWRCSAGETD